MGVIHDLVSRLAREEVKERGAYLVFMRKILV